jgi:tetratricopeptide (TPR) repeat protein
MDELAASLRSSIGDRYLIDRELGAGAMAVVYLAHDTKHDRSVALKVLRLELASAIGADRFHREIEVVAGLTHPHILPLHDSGEAGELLYYVMPYVDGGTLRQRLEREGQLPMADASRIAREVADALGFAHRRGVIHRDVKPGNILLAENHALLADFGIAHLADTDGEALTRTGLALGTPTYFSPEQATGEHEIDGRSDIYSLGCVLYESLTGEPPFDSPSVRGLISRHIMETPPRVREKRPDVSDGLEAVVQTALRKEPSDRFQTAEEMAESIGLVSGGFEIMAARALKKLIGPRNKWLHGWRLAVGMSAMALLLVTGGLVVRNVLQRPAFAGVYPTYAILPWEGDERTEEEKELARRGALELRYHLLDWESIEVVGGPSIEGPTQYVAQAGLALPNLSLSAGLALLETLNASHLVYVEAKVNGDSVELVASIYEGDLSVLEDQYPASGRKDQIQLITAELALAFLDLSGEPADWDDLVARSSNHEAWQQFDEGRALLRAWRLAAAEEFFQAAISSDSTFALAHYLLATTKYWRTVQDPERIVEAGPQIEFHVMQADRLGVGRKLRHGERQDVNAFKAFWAGDYETARTRYDSILSRNPREIETLVLAGAVETTDPWLVAVGGGEYLPRRDLNHARALYDSAVNLSPEVPLAWGNLFEIDRELAEAILQGYCPMFHPADGEIFPPYEFPEAAEQVPFCPYVEEGQIRWQHGALLPNQMDLALEGIRDMRARTTNALDRWSRVERDQPRPHEELAAWMLWERSVPACDAESLWADSLLWGAREHMELALALRGDTTSQDRVRLANVLLATGERDEAVRQANRALGELGDWRTSGSEAPRLEAANVYMAIGRGTEAADILQRTWDESTFGVPDPDNEGESISGGDVWGDLWGLAALGVTGEDDREMALRFDRLDRTWASPDYSERQQAQLRHSLTGLVSPALVRFPDRWEAWFSNWEDVGVEPSDVWRGILRASTDPEGALQDLNAVIAALESREEPPVRARDYYMPIVLARMLGEDAVAADLQKRAMACPLAVNRVDVGWGMRR